MLGPAMDAAAPSDALRTFGSIVQAIALEPVPCQRYRSFSGAVRILRLPTTRLRRTGRPIDARIRPADARRATPGAGNLCAE